MQVNEKSMLELDLERTAFYNYLTQTEESAEIVKLKEKVAKQGGVIARQRQLLRAKYPREFKVK